MKTALKLIGFASTLILLNAGMVGCSNDGMTQVNHSEQFPPDSVPRDSYRIEMAQASTGSLADGTLYPVNFDDTTLNSSGMAKLDRMLKANPPITLKVWMAIPDNDQAEARRVSVGDFLKDRGLHAEQIAFGVGPNPASYSSAQDGLNGLTKMESTDLSGGSSSGGSSSSGSSSGSSSSSGSGH